MTSRKLPPEASQAHVSDGDRLNAPSAARNADVICDLLASVAPTKGDALELASGTGQHVADFARRLPGLHWQPTEPDPSRRKSIDSYARDLDNVSPARPLDATRTGWAADYPDRALIVLVNLLHLISTPETLKLIEEAAKTLRPGGRFVIYGPFRRNGKLTSPGDARFHASLTATDPAIGYKNDRDIHAALTQAGLSVLQVTDMPSNNLAFVAERTSD